MSIKKKLGLGLASGVLGLSLVGGGTWAAFNDVETLSPNNFKAGVLDLVVGEGAQTFDLQNLKPGDSMQREFVLKNGGSLAIKEVLLTTTANFTDGGSNLNGDSDLGGANSKKAFLEQFEVEILYADVNSGSNPIENFKLIEASDGVTLYDLTNPTFDWGGKGIQNVDGKLNLAPVNADSAYTGLPVKPGDEDKVQIKLKMKDSADNKFMNDKAVVTLSMEAKQWEGKEHTENDSADATDKGSEENKYSDSENPANN